jgi:uncharacterized protein involved in response to NO
MGGTRGMAAGRGRSRPVRLPSAFLSYGFRPFFLGAGVVGAAAVPVWLLVFTGWLVLPSTLPPPLWHGHEMLLGYGTAALAGFLLTATPGWSGQAPISGVPLALLAGLWLLGRVAMAAGAGAPLVAALIDLAFLPALAVALLPALRAAARRNLVVLPILGGLLLADLGVQLDALGPLPGLGTPSLRLALDLLVLLIALIGGRIVPAFTANAAIDRAALLALGVLTVADLAAPGPVSGAIAVLAALVHGARLQGWWTRSILAQPIVWVLHLGYAWLVLGLVWKGVVEVTDLVAPGSAVHGLAVGAVGTMTLAVMSRATLGHTGRTLRAAPATVASYVLASVAAVLRLAAALLDGPLLLPCLILSGAAWSLAFVLFLVVHTPMLLRPRADRQPMP